MYACVCKHSIYMYMCVFLSLNDFCKSMSLYLVLQDLLYYIEVSKSYILNIKLWWYNLFIQYLQSCLPSFAFWTTHWQLCLPFFPHVNQVISVRAAFSPPFHQWDRQHRLNAELLVLIRALKTDTPAHLSWFNTTLALCPFGHRWI